MRQLYTARDNVEAEAIKSMLELEGIEAVVQGEPLTAVWGAVPIDPSTSPSIWVTRDDDFDNAVRCLEEFRHRRSREVASTRWKCDRCGELIESQFTDCWNCAARTQDEAAQHAQEVTREPSDTGDSNAEVAENPPVGATTTRVPHRSDRELWAETGIVLLLFLAPNLYGAVASQFWPDRYGVTSSLDSSLAYMASHAGYVGLVVYLIWRSGESWSAFGLVPPKWIVDPSVGLAFWGVASGIRIVCFRFLYGLIQPGFRASSQDASGMPPIPAGFVEIGVFVAFVACTAFSEELVMRAYLIPRFEQLLGSGTKSVCLSACLFASYHVYQGVDGTVSALLYGLVFGFLFCCYRRIWPLAIAHTITNLLAFSSLFGTDA